MIPLCIHHYVLKQQSLKSKFLEVRLLAQEICTSDIWIYIIKQPFKKVESTNIPTNSV